MSDGLDLLVHRHLDGTLSEAERKELQDRLRADPEARRRLAEMAFEHAQLREILEPAEEVVSPTSRWHGAAAAAILLAVALAFVLRREAPVEGAPVEAPAKEAGTPPPRREGWEGFRGRVHARVLERRDKARVILKVGEVLRLRDGNEAGEPGRLVGAQIGITTPRVKEGEPPSPQRDHAAYLMRLQPGQEVVLELRHAEGDEFAIVSLTEEQAEWARGGERRKPARDVPKKAEREER